MIEFDIPSTTTSEKPGTGFSIEPVKHELLQRTSPESPVLADMLQRYRKAYENNVWFVL